MASGLVVLLLIVLMIIASQVVAGLFKDTSNKLVVEYNELNAVEELKMSFSNLLISTTSYAVYGNEKEEVYFKLLIHQAEEKLEVCKTILTESHDLVLLRKFEKLIEDVETHGFELFQLKLPKDEQQIKLVVSEISKHINEGIIDIDDLLSETKTEINEYIHINNTVIKHSTITILSLGLIISLVILFGGWLIIRSLTRPIKELVTTTNKISSGDRKAKVKIDTKDEFHTLAESFNKMLDNLIETTVSKDYLDNILKNMFDALLVTDENMHIRSVNQAAAKMLGYSKSEMIEKHIKVLFQNSSDEVNSIYNDSNNLEVHAGEINNMDYLVSKSGKRLPALISCAILKDQDGQSNGLIIVCHDLTEKNVIKEKLEHSRKERLIDINEAEEEERIRIATDLHDGLGQMLTAISYAVQEIMPEDGESILVRERVERIQLQIDKAIIETKNLAHNLSPIVLKDFGMIVAIENLIIRANELYETRFRFDAFDFTNRIDPKREKVLYRICQESLNNIVKHAQAKNATYQIFWQDTSVVLVIEDDGVGFDSKAMEASSDGSGIGLISMRERVLAFDGNFSISSQPGSGTEIIVEIPCPKNRVYGNN